MTITYIIRPTGAACNFHCNYCYDLDSRSKNVVKMDVDSLFYLYKKAFLNNYYSKDKSLLFLWHGGEPLVAGQSFFEKAIELQKKFILFFEKKMHLHVENHIQTNALLLNENFMRFFEINNFKIGVSLDGDYKMNKDRLPFKKEYLLVLKNVRKLVSLKGVAYITTVWNLNHIGREKEYLEFVKKEKFIPRINSLDLHYNNKNYLGSVSFLAELAKKQGIYLKGLAGTDTGVDCNVGSCFLNLDVFCFDSDGKVYPCNRLVNKGQSIGSIFEDTSLSHMLKNSEVYRKRKKKESMCGCNNKGTICQGYGCLAETHKVTCKVLKKVDNKQLKFLNN